MKSVLQSSGKSVSGGTSELKPLPVPLGGQVPGAMFSKQGDMHQGVGKVNHWGFRRRN